MENKKQVARLTWVSQRRLSQRLSYWAPRSGRRVRLLHSECSADKQSGHLLPGRYCAELELVFAHGVAL
jgi:hypothetical protein